jgi:hypothetical protein
MAYSLWGFGTGFRSDTPLLPDGTFITTKWITLFYVPIIPLRSYRVKYLGSSSEFHFTGFSSTSQYHIMQKIPWDARKVTKFWLYIIAIIALFIGINVFFK